MSCFTRPASEPWSRRWKRPLGTAAGLARAQEDGTMRIKNATAAGSGWMQICHEGAWLPICDDHWGLNDAKVACWQLGYAGAESASQSADGL